MKKTSNSTINKYAQKNVAKYKKILKKIKEFDNIVIFRHQRPDFDALGTQYALKTWLKDNFPNKTVYAVGEISNSLMPTCFPQPDIVDENFFESPFLAIIVDCSVKSRIADERFKKAKYIIKFDHHPNIKPYGRLMVVEDEFSAAGELLMNMLYYFSAEYFVSKECAEFAYKAVVGDSGRFRYPSVNEHTFEIAKLLVESKINISEIYRQMYARSFEDIEVIKYILNNFKFSPKGICYYILNQETLDKYHLEAVNGKDNISLFDHYHGVHIWMSCTFDKSKNNWKVSLRSSAGVDVSKVAENYRGGGHAQASGATLKNLKELDSLIKDLEELL